MSALTESDAPAAVTGGGHAAQSANLTAIAVAARTGKGTETGTESGHRKTKVRTLRLLPFLHVKLLTWQMDTSVFLRFVQKSN